jgi:carbonic anhydrase
MAHIDPLLKRNRHFATTSAREGISIISKYPVYVITCLDPRTDPSALLELALGDAMVIRNAGGRVSPDVLTELAYIGYVSDTVLNPEGARFEVAVLHHNQCGTHFLADPEFRRRFIDKIGGDDATLAAQAVVDPEQTVRIDVELLRSSPILPPTITVSGHVYDVTTGLITTIVAAAPMHSATAATRLGSGDHANV